MVVKLVQKTSWLVMRFLNCFVFKFEVIGAEYLNELESKQKGPLIIVMNHKSFWDHFFLGAALKFDSPLWPLRFIAADWLFRNPFWMPLTALFGGFPTNKGRGLKVSLKIPMDILKNNGTVVFYPEGRIVKEDNIISEPKRGIGALSLWTKILILPAAIKGSRGMRQRKNVKLTFGESFYIQNLVTVNNPNPTKKDFSQAKKIIMDKVKKLYFSN